METRQIHGILSRIVVPPTRFIGVFAKDQIPITDSLPHYPSCFVANTHASNKKGEHWVAFWIDSSKHCEFFDSYGLSPLIYGFNVPFTSFNTMTIQSLNSSVCGQFCIYYLYCRSRGLPLAHILNSFSISNLEWNDYQVARFVNKHFGIFTSNHGSHFSCYQSCGPRVSCSCLSG